ncbi:hypothetical protein [Chitinophaga sp. Ak27]|uniref:hypothetical protein n=1 Tax=Chitinophaga sp. Ak27 TaxID=2726116 RepID=UPI00145D2EBA|nr:hypothetical protein [Chitinophaga sp. Ak27]NLU96306.1 hypothetical protein [Chitinophaga sp. Ak27]
MLTFKLLDKISTDYSGYNQLGKFYNFCLAYNNTKIHIDFTNIEWFDGNMCALLLAMLYSLERSNNLLFETEYGIIKEKFNVLFRNGFLRDSNEIVDDRKSTVPVMAFDCNAKDEFCNYVDHELLSHRGMPDNLDNNLKERIYEDLLEVFCNTNHHANTKDPFFVGGQYYPRIGILKFSMVDLGDGFLNRVSKATGGEVTSHLESIIWALAGNSSKLILDQTPGSLGIRSMYKYCAENKGVMQIVSGDGFWSSEYANTIFEEGRVITSPFRGTTINLIFKK